MRYVYAGMLAAWCVFFVSHAVSASCIDANLTNFCLGRGVDCEVGGGPPNSMCTTVGSDCVPSRTCAELDITQCNTIMDQRGLEYTQPGVVGCVWLPDTSSTSIIQQNPWVGTLVTIMVVSTGAILGISITRR